MKRNLSTIFLSWVLMMLCGCTDLIERKYQQSGQIGEKPVPCQFNCRDRLSKNLPDGGIADRQFNYNEGATIEGSDGM